jgi:hypothetical protein
LGGKYGGGSFLSAIKIKLVAFQEVIVRESHLDWLLVFRESMKQESDKGTPTTV